MLLSRAWLLTPLLLAPPGCRFGQVDQGRVVAFDHDSGLVTYIRDSNPGGKPRFDAWPPARIRIPKQRSEMGAAPEPGLLLDVDWQNNRALVYDVVSPGIRSIPFTGGERVTGVLRGDVRVSGRRFPLIDRAARKITIYSRSRRELITFNVGVEYLNLRDETWRFGDEIRCYYKQPEQALRLMNITKSDFSRGE